MNRNDVPLNNRGRNVEARTPAFSAHGGSRFPQNPIGIEGPPTEEVCAHAGPWTRTLNITMSLVACYFGMAWAVKRGKKPPSFSLRIAKSG